MKRTIPDNSRWVKLFPELAFLDDPADRVRLWHAACRKIFFWYLFLVILLAVLVVPVSRSVFKMTFPLLRDLLAIPDRSYHRLLAIAQGIVSGTMGIWANLLIFWLFRRRIQRRLRLQLLARGIPICLTCGYDLRAQVEPRCPECGTGFIRPSSPSRTDPASLRTSFKTSEPSEST